MNGEAEDELVRVGEAASMLGIDARRVYEAIDSGDLAARHVEGRGIRLDRADVDAYAGAH